MLATRLCGGLGLSLMVASVSPSHAAIYPLNWMSYAPVPIGSSIPNNSNYLLPGVGLVNVTYSFTGTFSNARLTGPASLNNGNIAYSGDNYTWGTYESFSAVNLTTGGPFGLPWSITFTFPSTLPAGSIALGVAGLGRTLNGGGQMTTATVLQSGTYLGEWEIGNTFGSNVFSGGTGSFSLHNSQIGAGGSNPWWNTKLAVVRIDDPISSLTVLFSQLRGDGTNLNIAFIPAPGAAVALALAGLAGARRRR